MNTMGTDLRITIFGASHGAGVGCVVDGLPPGLRVDTDAIMMEMELRRPGRGLGTKRKELDEPVFLSGVRDGLTTGTPVTIWIENGDVDSSAYERLGNVPRPGHADMPVKVRFPGADLRGGGQWSGRMTAPLVTAGALVRGWLASRGVEVMAYTRSIGRVVDIVDRDMEAITAGRKEPTRAADPAIGERMATEIQAAASDGDSVGGQVQCLCNGLPIGVGEPFFDTLDGELAKAMFAIPGVKAVGVGSGTSAAGMRGSEHNDPYAAADGELICEGNNAGGVLGGLSNGMPVEVTVTFKPTASIAKVQQSVDMSSMEPTELRIGGRHDPCIVPRAVPVVEAMMILVIADLMMRGGMLG